MEGNILYSAYHKEVLEDKTLSGIVFWLYEILLCLILYP